MQLPPVGTRVVVRYRLPAGSVPPLTDVIGHLVAVGPTLQVRTKRGDVVDIAVDDVVAIKALAAAPVRTVDIRDLEHAAALAWPGSEQQWLGRLAAAVRPGQHTTVANSALPLNVSTSGDAAARSSTGTRARGVTPLVSAPDRLLRLPPDADRRSKTSSWSVMSNAGGTGANVTLAPCPDEDGCDSTNVTYPSMC